MVLISSSEEGGDPGAPDLGPEAEGKEGYCELGEGCSHGSAQQLAPSPPTGTTQAGAG